MRTELKMVIYLALAGSTSQSPVDTDVLCKGRDHDQVRAALMELYQAHVICCCKIIKGKHESVVWWQVAAYGAFAQPRQLQQEPVATRSSTVLKELRSEVEAFVLKSPGHLQPEIILALDRPADQVRRIRNAISNLVQSKVIHTQGFPKRFRYYPGAHE